MIQACHQCQTSFEITDADLAFYDKISPVFGGNKFAIPPPKLCPECRFQRRMTFRNEWKLYNGSCSQCKKDMITIYSPDTSYLVYCHECWWSDIYAPLAYGIAYDPKQSFFDQYGKLLARVPKLGIHNTKSENSIYTNYSLENKNCYLQVGAVGSEDCLYGYRVMSSKNSVDCFDVVQSTLCYECIFSSDLYNCQYCRYCKNSRDLLFCEDCSNCSNCFGCVNLHNQEYCFFNKQLSREEYAAAVQQALMTKQETQKQFEIFLQQQPHQNLRVLNSETVSGDNLVHCKDCQNCFALKDSQDCQNSFIGISLKDSQDCNFTVRDELLYNSTNLMENYHVICANLSWYNSEAYYNSICFNSNHIFGCVGIKKGQYCILNKQYTKEEYEELVPQIMDKMLQDGEWGDFFDPSLSPFGYNETVAMDYFPLTKDAALQAGFNWSDFEPPKPEVKKIIPASKLPDNIKDIPDDILNWAIECEVTKKPFRIIQQELQFYRDHDLSIPRRHPDQRHRDRMALRNPRKLWDRNCMKCNTPIQTTYAPDRKEIVYCEACYLKEVY